MINTIINSKYKILALIDAGGIGDVYLAEDLRTPGGQPLAVKAIKKAALPNNFEHLVRLKNELAIAARITHPNIVSIREVLDEHDCLYIVMDHHDSLSLERWLAEKTAEPPAPLEIIVQLCSALVSAHAAGIIHRNIRPDTIIMDQNNASGIMIRLTGFGLWQVKDFMDRENDPDGTGGPAAVRDTIANVVRYMSPEQIGAFQAPVDERSDLYSAGILLFELLTGAPPFTENDPAAVIHAHAARVPHNPLQVRPQLPAVLGAMVLRLLEKDPDKRYQTAQGLLNDLHKVQNGFVDFSPGLEDVYARIPNRTPFIGREQELAELATGFHAAMRGSGGVIFLSGESGIGKTRIVDEFRHTVYQEKKLFLNCRAMMYEKKNPFGLFHDLATLYVKTFANYKTAKKKEIRAAINTFSRNLGDLLLRFNPALGDIIEQAAKPGFLEKDREQKRFLLTLSGFFAKLSAIEQGLVLFFDDLQWADEGSLQVLEMIMQDIAEHPLLVLVAYRDAETVPLYRIKKMLLAAKKNNFPTRNIALDPLSLNGMNRLVADIVHKNSADESVAALAGLIHEKSRGNPLFAVEIVRQLFDEKMLQYDDTGTGASIMRGYDDLFKNKVPQNVIEILSKRISYLDDYEKDIFAYAAVFGNSFTESVLSALCGEEHADDPSGLPAIGPVIDKGLALALIEKNPADDGSLLFVHDSIRESLYQSLTPHERVMIHRKIGRMLESRHAGAPPESMPAPILFDLAYHYIEGGDDEKIMAYACPAGLRAYENHAHDDALYYLESAVRLYETKMQADKSDQTANNTWMMLAVIICDIYLIIGQYDDAIARLVRLLPHTTTAIDRASVNKMISQGYFKKGDWKNCEFYAQEGLKLLAETVPFEGGLIGASIVKEFFVHLSQSPLPRSRRTKKNRNATAGTRIIIELYSILNWMYALNNNLKLVRSVLRMLNVAERALGESREYGTSLGFYGVLLMGMGLYKKSLAYQTKSLEMKKRFNDEWGMAQSVQFIGYCNYFKGDYTGALHFLDECIAMFERLGDVREVGLVLSLKVPLLRLFGDLDATRSALARYESYAKKTNDDYGIGFSLVFHADIAFMQGDYAAAEELFMQAAEFSREKELWMLYCTANIRLSELFIEREDADKALFHAEIARGTDRGRNFMKELVLNYYILFPRAHVLQYRKDARIDLKTRNALLKKIKTECAFIIKKVKKNYPFYMDACGACAQYYVLKKKAGKAEFYFTEAIRSSRSKGFKSALAKDLFHYGLFLIHQTDIKAGRERMEEAFTLFSEIGDRAYIQKIYTVLGVNANDGKPDAVQLVKRIRTDKKFSLVRSVIEILHADGEFEEKLNRVLSLLAELIGATAGYFFIRDEKTKMTVSSLVNLNETGPEANEDIGDFYEILVNRAMETGKPLVKTDRDLSEEYPWHFRMVRHQPKSVLAVPVFLHGNAIGGCCLDSFIPTHLFAEDDIALMQLIMKQVSLSADNVLLHRFMEKKDNIANNDSFYARYDITNREREIIVQLIQGASSRELCTNLSLAFNTVRTHIRNIYTKTGVTSRVELINLMRALSGESEPAD